MVKKRFYYHSMRSVLLAAFISIAIYLIHSTVLGSWIIDDAGISFAYARSLAEGHGLVAQPGAAPVEGFTNLLWVLLLSIPIKLHAFDPVITPKLLAGCCVALSFILTGYLLSASGSRPAWLTVCALSITAGISGFTIWCASGLENALYVLVVSALAVVSSTHAGSERARVLRSAVAGICLFFVFCTRPDGALYFWIPAFLLGIEEGSERRRRPLVAYVAAFVGPWLLLTLFRIFYFHDFFPNTFYAKQGEGANIFAWLLSRLPLYLAGATVAIIGVLAMAAIALSFHGLGRWVKRRLSPIRSERYVLGLFFVTAILVYHALRGDWMPEYRFATPAFLFGPAALLTILWDVSWRVRVKRTLVVATVAVTLMVMVCAYSYHHTSAFAKSPTIPFASVRKLNLRIAHAIKSLGPDVAVLTPDVGGALWENRFRVIDLVGLTDRALGQTIARDRQSIREHLLNERRPEGVWLHAFWMGVTGFDVDPTFAEMYAPVWEERTSPESPPTAGFYLRRDLVRIGSDGMAQPHASLKVSN